MLGSSRLVNIWRWVFLTFISVRLDVSFWFYSVCEGCRCLLISSSCQPRIFSVSPSCFMFPVLSLIFTVSTPPLSLSCSQGSLWSFTSKDVFVPLFRLQRRGLRQTGAWNCPRLWFTEQWRWSKRQRFRRGRVRRCHLVHQHSWGQTGFTSPSSDAWSLKRGL